MKFKIFRWHSLKTQVTLFTLAIFLLSIWSLSFYASRMLRNNMERLTGEQQFSTATFIATEVNDELSDRLKALKAVAETISPTVLGNTAALQTLIQHRTILPVLFNAGTFVTGIDGTAIISQPKYEGRVGVNYMDRDFIAAALKEGKATIGRPVIGKQTHTPVIVIGVPIFDVQGNVIGALAGVTDLSKPNFLDKVTENRYGETGGYELIAPKYRLIVTATDKSHIMQQVSAPGVSSLNDRFIQGHEGSGVLVMSSGVEALASAKRVPAAGWFVTVLLPTAEAFASIHDVQQRILLATIFLTILTGGLTWGVLGRQLAPMLATLSETNQYLPLPIISRDETSELVGAFNRLLEALGQQGKALRESEERFRSLMETIPNVAVQGYALDGTVLFWNRASELLYGYNMEDVKGANLLDLIIPPEMHEAVKGAMQQMIKTGEPIPAGELILKRKDGSRIPVLSSHALVHPFNRPSELFCLDIDLTDRKQAEHELQKSNQLLTEAKILAESANTAKSQFLANMSHEIRTPMNGVLGMTQLLEMTGLSTEQREYVDALKLSGKNLMSLISDILDLSKIEAGKIIIEDADFSLKQCITDVVMMQQFVSHEKGLKLEIEISEDIPHQLVGDQLRVKQILLNLMGNAVKFTAQGSITVSAHLLEQHNDSRLVRIAVRDTGIGISPEAADQIFKPFTQEDGSICRKYGGTGLGLTISRRMAELLGGTISVESTPGGGSCFTVTLPLTISTTTSILQAPPATASTDGDSPPLRILLVDDDQVNIKFGVSLLKRLGHSVTTAENGKQCLIALEKGPFDIVLMDIQMPVMNGEETLLEIRGREQNTTSHLPVIALTAHSMRGDKDRLLEIGFDGYVSKPLFIKDLVEEMKKVWEEDLKHPAD